MTQSRGSVPVELTGDPAHAGETLKCWRTAETIFQDTWEKRISTLEEERKVGHKTNRKVEIYTKDEIALEGKQETKKSVEGEGGKEVEEG